LNLRKRVLGAVARRENARESGFQGPLEMNVTVEGLEPHAPGANRRDVMFRRHRNTLLTAISNPARGR
jgi:hypothetical protein